MRELLSASIHLAEAGGLELAKIQRKGELKTAEKSGKNDLVTAGDHASHDIMYHGMKSTFPKLKDAVFYRTNLFCTTNLRMW